MKYYKTKKGFIDSTGNMAVSHVVHKQVKMRQLSYYGELFVDGGKLHRQVTLCNHKVAERTDLVKKDKVYRDVCKSVSAHGRMTRNQKKRLGVVPSIRFKEL